MDSAYYYEKYGLMRQEELVREAERLHLMRLLREAGGSRLASFLVRAGRRVTELGRSLETAGRSWHRKPVHG